MRPDSISTSGLGLTPTAIVALGMAGKPAERLIGLQAATGRLIGWLATLPLLSRRTQTAALRLRPTPQREL